MTININIKADVHNIIYSDIFLIINEYQKTKQKIIEFKGFQFKIEADINLSMNYSITELK